MQQRLESVIEFNRVHIAETIERWQEAYKDQEEVIKSLNNDIDDVLKECNKKLAMTDGKRIWRHFQRFAEYEDLRDLYKKCIPEISKFESKILDFDDDLQKCRLVLRNFDEILM